MRDLQYKGYSFRLSEETYKKLKKVKEEKNLSWNLLFMELLEKFGELDKII